MILPGYIFINEFPMDLMDSNSNNNDDDDEKGKRFLELIDEQSNTQRSIVSKVSALIKYEWQSPSLQSERITPSPLLITQLS